MFKLDSFHIKMDLHIRKILKENDPEWKAHINKWNVFKLIFEKGGMIVSTLEIKEWRFHGLTFHDTQHSENKKFSSTK